MNIAKQIAAHVAEMLGNNWSLLTPDDMLECDISMLLCMTRNEFAIIEFWESHCILSVNRSNINELNLSGDQSVFDYSDPSFTNAICGAVDTSISE